MSNQQFTIEGKAYEFVRIGVPRSGETTLVGGRAVVADEDGDHAVPNTILREVEPVSPFFGNGKSYIDADGDKLTIQLATFEKTKGLLIVSVNDQSAYLDPRVLLNDMSGHFDAALRQAEAASTLPRMV